MAKVTARFNAVVDLPSAGSELETTKTFVGESTWTNCMLVRSTRKASAHGVASSRACAGLNLREAVSLKMLPRSEEHTSELQSLMRISYAVFCLKKKNKYNAYTSHSILHY